MNPEITTLRLKTDAEWCASIMVNSEPWVTLGRTYEESLRIITDPSKEVYLARLEGELSGFVILNMKGAFVGYVQTICLDPQVEGQGVRNKLIEICRREDIH